MSSPIVIGDESPFLKRILIPFWFIRIVIMLIQIALYGILIAGLRFFRDNIEALAEKYNTDLNYDAIMAVSCVIVAVVLLCLTLDLVCIIKRARRTLSPPFFLGVNIVQSLFYTVNFILGMINARDGAAYIGISVIILLSFLGLLAYASIVYHRYRTGTLRGTYVPAGDQAGQEVHGLVGMPMAYAPPPPAFPPQPYSPQPYSYAYPQQTAYYDPQGIPHAQQHTYTGHA